MAVLIKTLNCCNYAVLINSVLLFFAPKESQISIHHPTFTPDLPVSNAGQVLILLISGILRCNSLRAELGSNDAFML